MYINHSGGAAGADTYWEILGEKYNVKTIAYSFNGHKSSSKNIKILTKDELLIADELLIKTNKILKRKFPTKSEYVNNLLRRNYYQILNAEEIFAITRIDNNKLVEGGTGWAVHMCNFFENKNCYVFDMNSNRWYRYINHIPTEIDIPHLTQNFAGIGARDINEKGIKQINLVYEKSFTN